MSEKALEKSKQDTIDSATRMAHARAVVGIPFAKEIWQTMDNEYAGRKDIFPDNPNDITAQHWEIIAMYEARYRTSTNMLMDSGVSQILELASGMSPRGIDFCMADPNTTYVEMDLPEQVGQKLRVLEKVMGEKGIPGNLHVLGGDATSKDDFNNALKCFDMTKPIVIMFEGLLVWLKTKQRGQVMENVKNALTQFGGACITSDIAIVPGQNAEYTACKNQRYGDTAHQIFVNKPSPQIIYEQMLNGFACELRPWDKTVPELGATKLGKIDPSKVIDTFDLDKLRTGKLELQLDHKNF